MATSSITANFCCDNAKAANEFVRLLATPAPVVAAHKLSVYVVEHATPAARRAFAMRFKKRWNAAKV